MKFFKTNSMNGMFINLDRLTVITPVQKSEIPDSEEWIRNNLGEYK